MAASAVAHDITAILNKWAFPVLGVLALLAMVAVFAIAGRDQLLGIERWCFGQGQATGAAAATVCRDDREACELARRGLCRQRGARWVTSCRPADAPEGGSAAAEQACSELR